MWFPLLFLLFPLLVNAERFVRFISDDGKEYTGDAILPPGTVDASKSKSAHVIKGDILGDFTVTKEVKVSLRKRDVVVKSSKARCCPIAHQGVASAACS